MYSEKENVPSLTTPEQAADMLVSLGLNREDWEKMAQSGLHNHTNRALIHIALGSEPRSVNEVIDELFPDDPHGPQRKDIIEEQLSYPEEPFRN